MGEAKRRKKISEHITIIDGYGLEELGLSRGALVSIMLIGAGLIAQEVFTGGRRLLAKENSTEIHAYRLAFGIWDRIRTGEYNPWQCSLCAKSYRGLALLSVFALIDDPRKPPAKDKPGVMALVCHDCDCISTAETKLKVEKRFGLMTIETNNIRQ